MKLSVVIPAFNEAERLPATLREAHTWLSENLDEAFEIVVVDDGSRDTTCEAVLGLMTGMPELKLVRQPENRGKGAAVRRGMLEARGNIRLFMDADTRWRRCSPPCRPVPTSSSPRASTRSRISTSTSHGCARTWASPSTC